MLKQFHEKSRCISGDSHSGRKTFDQGWRDSGEKLVGKLKPFNVILNQLLKSADQG